MNGWPHFWKVGAALLLCLIATPGCRRPTEIPQQTWAAENRAAAAGIEAVLRVSSVDATVGQRIEIVLDVESEGGTQISTPEFQPSGLEPVDFIALPVTLGQAGSETRRFRWIFQAGPPKTLAGQELRLSYTSGASTAALTLRLPGMVIHPAAAGVTLSDTLPAMEERDAL